MKKLIAFIAVLAMTVLCTACAGKVDISKIKGDWTISTINGYTLEEYAETIGTDKTEAIVNITVTDDTFTSTNITGSQSFKYDEAADGIQVKDDAGNLLAKVLYDSEKDSISYTLSLGNGNSIECVFARGTAEISAPAADAATAEA
ncbi:MAG: hypothetical protein J6A16_00315 [Oscillospiraceae bacterium]|nr:hypothetical protein [Oscillospiraceae bacterium]